MSNLSHILKYLCRELFMLASATKNFKKFMMSIFFKDVKTISEVKFITAHLMM